MKKHTLYIIIGLVLLLGISTFVAIRFNPNLFTAKPQPIDQTANQIILYYGTTCPHCVKVEEFMAANKVEEKMTIIKKESLAITSKNNAIELTAKAKFCKINTASIGVPFLWVGPEKKCLIGDEEVINYFKSKLGI